jgi:hypothetical protein
MQILRDVVYGIYVNKGIIFHEIANEELSIPHMIPQNVI